MLGKTYELNESACKPDSVAPCGAGDHPSATTVSGGVPRTLTRPACDQRRDAQVPRVGDESDRNDRDARDTRPSRLADLLGIAVRSTTQVVDDLVTSGLLNKRPDPADRRAVLVSPTDAGRQAAAQIATVCNDLSRRFMDALNEQDRAALHPAAP